jgi:hypothetical protein
LARREIVAARGWPADDDGFAAWFRQGIRLYHGDPA